ncbi:MAG TPA: hypothetical protein VKQ72_03045 [Aggregatilineales bacterium]|nr:hypothetical protein [Aggregatilineales bacterium]
MTIMMNNKYSRPEAQRDMNLALDNELGETARASFEEHLRDSAQDSALWERMQRVDHLLHSEGVLEAPPDMAANIMTLVAKVPAPGLRRASREQPSRTPIEMLLTTAVMLIIALPALLFIHHLLADPAALNTLVQQIGSVLDSGAKAIDSALRGIANFNWANIILALSLVVSGLLTVLTWGWMVRAVSLRRQQVVYRIPVEMA